MSLHPYQEDAKDSLTTRLAESGRLPDPLLRLAIRRMCAQRLKQERKGGTEAVFARQEAWLRGLREDALAVEKPAANRRHPELPPEFFQLCLGRHLKYSACLWDETTRDLTQAEEKMLRLYCERGELHNRQRILELGCGWGSLTLWMAERYPQSRITAVSNSRLQKDYIEARCRERAIFNVEVLLADVNTLALATASYDRVVSIEMFEHMRDYQALLGRIADWLAPGGKLFVHLFCHKELLYLFEAQGKDDWMGRHFFTGRLMPSADTLLQFQDALQIEERWLLSGTHYEKTANAWLANQDAHHDKVMGVMRQTYGLADAALWYQRWRMFWMACAELFGYSKGEEWMVAHYRFRR
ncbi:SAM-dependent methyltransferase [Pseudoxanthomonas composti]|uniref:Class I SAM-dependent methyltransferase n=1 Tax=Pseudoxanthomonas composti TaxID=2137479 RepID=A0A4Q1JXG1_9GAMM|nr:class I SAM-dependent methyltransferase [Pseudoxanthomonas composti]RXR07364.1 class I SAM-dependent methyltransferase [Pseudoxanthomonas composti]